MSKLKSFADQVRAAYEQNPTFNRSQLANELGCSRKTIFKHLKDIANITDNSVIEDSEVSGDKLDVETDKDSMFINSHSIDNGDPNKITITNIDQAIAYAKVDTELWEVTKQRISTSQVTVKLRKVLGQDEDGKPIIVHEPKTYTNWHVRVWLAKKQTTDLAETLKLLIKEIPKCKTPKPPIGYPSGRFAYEIALLDAHIGKFAWEVETDAPSYDTKIACENYLDACKRLLQQINGFKLEKIIFPFGHDFMHVENLSNQTYLGKHSLDADTRMPKIYARAKMAILEALYMCREIAPVDVLWIPGNHDIHISYIMADMLKEHFKDCKWVTVDTSPTWRKCRVWGNLIVGFTHDAAGRKKKITVNALPQFWPEEWGKSKFREWHIGHKHKKMEESFYPTQTVGSVIVRQISTLGPIDAWHYQNLFVDAVPAGEAFLWDKEDGVVAHNNANIHFNSSRRG